MDSFFHLFLISSVELGEHLFVQRFYLLACAVALIFDFLAHADDFKVNLFLKS